MLGNQMQKENLRNLEQSQNYVLLEHHHQTGQASYHRPGPGKKGSIQSVLSKNQLPRPRTV